MVHHTICGTSKPCNTVPHCGSEGNAHSGTLAKLTSWRNSHLGSFIAQVQAMVNTATQGNTVAGRETQIRATWRNSGPGSLNYGPAFAHIVVKLATQSHTGSEGFAHLGIWVTWQNSHPLACSNSACNTVPHGWVGLARNVHCITRHCTSWVQ